MAVKAHDRSHPRQMRRYFFAEMFRSLRFLWPIFSGILVVMTVSGIIVGRIEHWRLDESLYFTFVTGLTIGYGDLTPKHLAARLLALVIGFAGVVLTGLVAAVGVQALKATERSE